MVDESSDQRTAKDGRIAHDRALSAPFAAQLESLALRDALRACFDAVPSSVTWGYPRLLPAAALSDWVRASDVLVELARTPVERSFHAGVALHAASATRLVDRMLGAAETGAASARAGPSDAECGLIAYAAARALAAVSSAWIVRDVRLDPLGAGGPREPLVHWPFALTLSFGRIDGALWLAPSIVATLAPVRISLLLRDAIESAATVDELAVGDLLVSDTWWLTDTTEGMVGDVLVGVEFAAGCLRARLARDRIEARSEAVARGSDQLELIIAERELPLLQLARLAGGEPVDFALDGSGRVRLARAGSAIGEGELVTHHRRLGVRITALAPAR